MALKCTVNILKWIFPKVGMCHKRYFSERSLVGRDFISPEYFSAKDLKYFLWTATDFKGLDGRRNKQILQNLSNCNATVIMSKPHINFQVLISNALNSLGCKANIVIDKHWEDNLCSIAELGRTLSKLSNIIVAVECEHDSVDALRDAAYVPVINYSSTSFQMIECLANLLTIQERYCFLQGLKICWIGPPNAALNTYIFMAARFKMNIQYLVTCVDNLAESMELMNKAIKCAIQSGTQLKEVLLAKDAIYRAHVITTTMHSSPEFQITRELLSEAAVNWIFLHHFPRSDTEVTQDVFCSENSFVYEAFANQMWVFMAVVTHLLRDYHPSLEIPDFEGLKASPQDYYQP